MKKVMFAFLATLFVVGVSSCEKDKTEENDGTTTPTIKNEVVLEGKTSVLKGGFIEDYGQADPNDSLFFYEGTNYDLYLYTENVSLNTTDLEFEGTGLIIYFESFSKNGNGIATGKYTFDENSLAVNTFDLGLILEAKAGEQFDDADYAVTSGSYDVTNNGNNNYEIKGTLSLIKVAGGNATVTFSYKGAIPIM